MTLSKHASWQVTHITAILGVIATLSIATHLIGQPRVETLHASSTDPASSAAALQSVVNPKSAHAMHASSQPKVAGSEPSDPREVVVGQNGISNRYTLQSVDRKRISSTRDELTVKLHVKSLAIEHLVSPFESDMLALKSDGLDPINPRTRFRSPIPSGNSRDQEIIFTIPSDLNLSHTSLQIHYYSYQNEVPLNLTGISTHAP